MPYIYQRLTAHDAVDAFRRYDRLDSNFTANEVRTLFDYYESLAEDIGEPIELDVIAWCCDWDAYGSILDAAEDYDNDEVNGLLHALEHAQVDDRDDIIEQIIDWFRDRTEILESGDSILVRAF